MQRKRTIATKKQAKVKQKKVVDQIVDHAEKSKDTTPADSSDVFYYPSGVDLLDLVLGGGGYQNGKIINIIGDRSSGKTLLACEVIAASRRILGDRLRWYYDDAEAGFSFDTKKLYGFDIADPDAEGSFTVEGFRRSLQKQLNLTKPNEFLIYVLDSFDSLTTEAEIKQTQAKQKAADKGEEGPGTYGTSKAKEQSQFFRLMRKEIKDRNCLLIVISQVRDNIGVMFGEKHTRSGGKALGFYASIEMWLAESEKLKRKKVPCGVSIKVRTKKNKQLQGNPFRECFVQMWFDYGVDNTLTSLNYLYNMYTDKGKLKWIKGSDDESAGEAKKIRWDGKEMTIEHAVKYIELRGQQDKLKQLVTEKWNEFQDSISNKGRKPKWQE